MDQPIGHTAPIYRTYIWDPHGVFCSQTLPGGVLDFGVFNHPEPFGYESKP